MKTYTTKPNDTLGSIADAFGMPSWKYLYKINKDKIGDNPDLLKEGLPLDIPQWDSTTGDEKIEAKGESAHDYTGGLRYAYPWVPYSITLTTPQGEVIKDGTTTTFKAKKKFKVYNGDTGDQIAGGDLAASDALEILVADAPHKLLTIDDVQYA